MCCESQPNLLVTGLDNGGVMGNEKQGLALTVATEIGYETLLCGSIEGR